MQTITQKENMSPETADRMRTILRSAQVRLRLYTKECRTHPMSIYYQSLISKTEKEIYELKMQLV